MMVARPWTAIHLRANSGAKSSSFGPRTHGSGRCLARLPTNHRRPLARSVSSEPLARTTLFEDVLAALPRVDAQSPAEAKIALFRALFSGREDIHAVRWENSRTGKSGWSPAVVGGPSNARRPDREYVALTDAAIESHLTGRIHVGLYPLLSYDRLIPAQDFMPKGSFGNLIALPLHGQSRRAGTTVFIDADLAPFGDQWAHLSTLRRVTAAAAASLADQLRDVAAGPLEPTYRRPFQGPSPTPPPVIKAVAGPMLAIDRIGLPPALLAALKHLASLHNPEYYQKERLRFSTWDTPRLIRCYEETVDQLLLPRGLREPAEAVVEQAGSRLDVTANPRNASTIGVELRSELDAEQQVALPYLVRHALGVLVAPPGAGKTVVACAAIAARAVATLVLVDRQPLLEQWRERLTEHLGLARKQIGTLGGGSGRLKGRVDVAMVQSLARREDVAELTARYGLVVVDECHHVPAVTFERVVRQIGAPAWLGLTATPYRRDGLEGLITMYCGPVRHRVGSAPAEGAAFVARSLHVHETPHVDPAAVDGGPGPSIQAVFRGLVEDGARTQQICADVVAALQAGRNCLVLSQWKEHVRLIEARLVELELRPEVLVGDVGRKERRAVTSRLAGARPGDGVVLVATGSLLGEGFDCPPLDTLFVAFPVAFRGRIVQYAGRVLRPMDGKDRVEVHDYVDVGVPVLARMLTKRLGAYASLGFDVRGIGGRRR
jgi:superfamily II DNA or RNA helicase